MPKNRNDLDTAKLSSLQPGPVGREITFTDVNVRDVLAAYRRGVSIQIISAELGIKAQSLYTRLGVWLLHSRIKFHAKNLK